MNHRDAVQRAAFAAPVAVFAPDLQDLLEGLESFPALAASVVNVGYAVERRRFASAILKLAPDLQRLGEAREGFVPVVQVVINAAHRVERAGLTGAVAGRLPEPQSFLVFRNRGTAFCVRFPSAESLAFGEGSFGGDPLGVQRRDGSQFGEIDFDLLSGS